MTDWDAHNETKNHGCLEHDLSVAIQQSLMLGGQSVGVPYSEEAAAMLREWAEWESGETYSFRGLAQNDDREWRVHLLDTLADDAKAGEP